MKPGSQSVTYSLTYTAFLALVFRIQLGFFIALVSPIPLFYLQSALLSTFSSIHPYPAVLVIVSPYPAVLVIVSPYTAVLALVSPIQLFYLYPALSTSFSFIHPPPSIKLQSALSTCLASVSPPVELQSALKTCLDLVSPYSYFLSFINSKHYPAVISLPRPIPLLQHQSALTSFGHVYSTSYSYILIYLPLITQIQLNIETRPKQSVPNSWS